MNIFFQYRKRVLPDHLQPPDADGTGDIYDLPLLSRLRGYTGRMAVGSLADPRRKHGGTVLSGHAGMSAEHMDRILNTYIGKTDDHGGHPSFFCAIRCCRKVSK